MTTGAERASQRREWKRALAAAAAAKRNQRYRPAEPAIRAGMIRKTGTVAILRGGLARCPFPGCPVRYAGGSDQPCRDHAEETAADWADRLAELAGTPPGETGGEGSDGRQPRRQ